jgi:RHS repeat-associated protein
VLALDRAISYDYENRMTQVNDNGTIATFTYNARGNRVKKTVNDVKTYYFFSNYEEVIANGEIKVIKYYFGPNGRIAQRTIAGTDDELLYVHTDYLGSAVRMTNTNGDPVQSLAYDPYGRTVFSAGSKNPAYHFTGQEKDRGTGLYYYGARYYDPELGRFIQADTVLDGLNRYTYCGNNPVVYVDPTGMYGEYSHPNEKPGSYDSYYQYYYGPIDGAGVFLVRNDDGSGYFLDCRIPDIETECHHPDDFGWPTNEPVKPPKDHAAPGNSNKKDNVWKEIQMAFATGAFPTTSGVVLFYAPGAFSHLPEDEAWEQWKGCSNGESIGTAIGGAIIINGAGSVGLFDDVLGWTDDLLRMANNLPGTGDTPAKTVWEFIKGTQEIIPGTNIPKSFTISAGKDFWIHPNATKHIAEFINRSQTFATPLNSQTLLSSFQSALKTLAKQGFEYDVLYQVGSWEFKIGAPLESGLLPTVYHAVFKGNP